MPIEAIVPGISPGYPSVHRRRRSPCPAPLGALGSPQGQLTWMLARQNRPQISRMRSKCYGGIWRSSASSRPRRARSSASSAAPSPSSSRCSRRSSRHARRLCRADAGQIYISDGRVYRLAFLSGGSRSYRDFLTSNPIPPGTGTLVGKVAVERRDDSHPRRPRRIRTTAGRRACRWRAANDARASRCSATGEVIGVISLIRTKVDPFTDRQIELVTTFAAQGAIAIQNGNLFNKLETQSVELARSVEELQALSDVGQAVSSTLELQEVLQTIVTHAVQLSGTDGGSIFEFDEDTEEFRLRTAYGTSDELVEALRATRIRARRDRWSAAPPAAREPQAGARPDDGRRSDPHLEQLLRHGWRSMLAVPLLREDRILGALVVRRKDARALSGRDGAICSRPSRASPRWRSRTRSCSARSRRRAAARGREPAQVRVPGEHVARAAHAAQRDHRLLRGADRADVRRAERASRSEYLQDILTPGGTCSR